jgi:hypothetical protein
MLNVPMFVVLAEKKPGCLKVSSFGSPAIFV